MDKQIVEISQDGFYLSLYRGFLVIENSETGIQNKVPLDHILSLVLSANNVTLSKNIINAIMEQGATIISCDKSYLPHAITLPYIGHWLVSARIKQQLDVSVPLQKNLWKNIIQHKILNQAQVLEHFFPNHKNLERLRYLAKETLSDDKRNHEGAAAGIYFKSLFGKQFIRNRLCDDANILLNYTYTIVRAMVARAAAGNGLLPYIGIKHCGKTNPLPLVDDLMEPFRAIADKFVYEELSNLINVEQISLTPEIKRHLAMIISSPVQTEKGIMSLNDAIYDFVSSLVTSYELKKIALKHPKFCYSVLPKLKCQ